MQNVEFKYRTQAKRFATALRQKLNVYCAIMARFGTRRPVVMSGEDRSGGTAPISIACIYCRI